ncbi:chlorophyllide a oxygenase [Micractinium conductrix]|uniref:Chlorophyllide a oxygenase n=1 Tax=Micractinium conductrix TaxID=554055 RepID=A0A2P6V9M2_9CHLO|nr:chlorophyllide a oxygenase [Micractinium conductrix]|eukprot:PSC70793.1 chlorophyllide a oxygenase [Micractinium conductrix]
MLASRRSLTGAPASQPSWLLLPDRRRQRSAAPAAAWGRNEEPPPELSNDPEARFKQYGKDFGGNFLLQGVMESAPRVRVRTSADRARDQLADLAVLNERLAGRNEDEAAVIRQRLEHMKRRRRNWQLVYQHVTRADALCTLSAIEEANARVEELLSEESRERHSVSALKRQLVELQGEVSEAHQRLHLTQARVEQNLQRISELKEESARAQLGDAVQRAEATEGAALDGAAVSALAPAAATAGSSGSAAAVVTEAGAAPAPAALGTPRAVPARRAAASAAHSQAPRHATRASGGAVPCAALSPAAEAAADEAQRRRGLYSGLEMEEELKNHWFAVSFVSKLGKEDMVPFELFGQAWVLFRDAEGRPACVLDECAHRACPLSIGRVVDGQVECLYHGWRFNSAGECTKMPSTMLCRGVAVSALPCGEHDGFVWVWPGWEEPALPLPTFTRPPPGYRIHAEIEVEVPVEHGLLVENLLDLAHAPFTHTTTFARGWPVPDAVKFHASRLLGGNWDPYPIEMSFNPPCCTLSHVGLARLGKTGAGSTPQECENRLHQLHVCLPARAGHTRLLYRMATNFLWWTEYIPGIQHFWEHIAGQVLGEDLVLVVGQQDRLLRGGDTWCHPVSYDKLAVRYRRWRNSLGLSGAAAQASGADAEGPQDQGINMRSGEMFSLDEDDSPACSSLIPQVPAAAAAAPSMGIFDRLRGKREDAAAEMSSAEAAAAVSPSLDLTEHAGAPAQAGPSARQQQFTKTFGVPASEQLYNPYDGLGAALDRRVPGSPGAFRVSKQPEFLFSEEALVHKRSWSENLTYYTGVGYLAGAVLGGGRGAVTAVSAPVALAGVESSQRLRLNQLLNTSGKMGRGAGNALGVLGLLFASFESFSGYLTNGQVPDEANTLIAGAATGTLYRSVRGPRQAAAAAVVGTAGAAALLAARKFVNPGL